MAGEAYPIVNRHPIVIPAKSGIHFRSHSKIKMDPGFRRDDGYGGFRRDDD
jgi:hypothetical protein